VNLIGKANSADLGDSSNYKKEL